MIEAFRDFILQNKLVPAGSRVLLAVSGGIDSVVMLDLFYRAGFSIAIAHVNFNLRAGESDEDERFVHSLAAKYGIAWFVKNVDTVQFAEKNKLSIQEAAREIRYQWFEEICLTEGFERVAVAQHADDQIETFFINLLRGSGTAGLKGMPVTRGSIIRPLLFTGRTEIEQYVKEHKLLFREDSSNLSDKYLRNKIRHHLLSELEKIMKDYRQMIGKSILYLSEEHLLLQHLIQQKREELFQIEDDEIRIPVKAMKNFPDFHALLFYLLKDYGFNREVSDTVCDTLQKDNTGKLFHSGGYRLLVDREFLILKKKAESKEENVFHIRFAGEEISEPVHLTSEIIEDIDGLQIEKDPSRAYFDIEKLTFPLNVRKWGKGDRFVPFGMKGSKLVSDYLIDSKISRFEKEKVYVLESAGKIIWLIGYRTSDDFKITGTTKKIVLFYAVK